MSRPIRVLLTAVLVMLGVGLTLFAGNEAMGCLGPIGVTEVQCAKATGVIPGVGIGLPFLALAALVGTLVIWTPSDGQRVWVLIGGCIGGALGAAAFLALRPTRMEGFTSSGAWLSIHRPLDVPALATALILGAWLGMMVTRLACEIRGVGSVRRA